MLAKLSNTLPSTHGTSSPSSTEITDLAQGWEGGTGWRGGARPPWEAALVPKWAASAITASLLLGRPTSESYSAVLTNWHEPISTTATMAIHPWSAQNGRDGQVSNGPQLHPHRQRGRPQRYNPPVPPPDEHFHPLGVWIQLVCSVLMSLCRGENRLADSHLILRDRLEAQWRTMPTYYLVQTVFKITYIYF